MPRASRHRDLEAGQQPAETESPTVRRLNWGCRREARPGWINSDRTAGPGVDVVADIRERLPIESGTIDYAVGIHSLQELAYPELVPALGELFRVLRPGGTLRLVLPDLDAGIRAYTQHDDDSFLVPRDRVRSRGGRFIAHMLSCGRSRTLFTFDFAEELLLETGFVDVTRCRYGETASRFQEMTQLDPSDGASMFIEATRPPGRRPFLKVLDAVSVEQDGERLAGCNLDAPQRGLRSHDGSLEIVGWVVGRSSRVREVQVLADGDEMGRARVALVRPNVGRQFPRSPGSRSAGFRTALTAEGEGLSELLLRAVLEDGSVIPLWRIRIDASRQPPADPDPSPSSRKAEGGTAAPAH